MDKELSDITKDKEQNEENMGNIHFSSPVLEEISIYDVFSRNRHKVILCWVSFTGILLPFSDTIYLPSIHTMAIDLNTTDALVNLTISLYLLSVAVCGLIWGVISDRWGRNLTMRLGLLLFLISSIICIFTVDIIMLSILRIFQGSSISVTLVVGLGIIADIYPPDQRGWATGIFFVPGLLGVALGSTIGGILAYYLGWRSIFVFQSIVTFIILIVYVIIIPETHQYKVLVKTTDKKIIERNEISQPKLRNPFLPLLYLTNLSLIPYILSASTAFASMIIDQCNLAIILAEQPYSSNELKIGLASIPLCIGQVVGSILGGYWSDKADKCFKVKRIENRLIPGMICFMLIPIGLIIFGWSFEYDSYVSIPLIGATMVTVGQAFYDSTIFSYLTVKEQQNSATVSAANNFLNFIFAGITLAISRPIINTIDTGPFFTIIAFIDIMTIILAVGYTFKKIRIIDKNYEPM